jgi:Protein of unknown function (DUF3616)
MMRSAGSLLVIAALCAATCEPAAAKAGAELTTYRGTCDGSAGVALDEDRFVVADDDRNVLRVYRTGQADAKFELDLDQFLEAPAKKKPGPDGKTVFKEADLEGAARIGDRIYWIGSHARDSKGEAEPGRSRFFATRIVAHPDGPRLEPIRTRAYKTLREDMFDDPKLAHLKLSKAFAPDKKIGPKPESKSGFNIEGLAATPDGRLLIGFRNPRPDNAAIVIPLDNPAEVLDGSKPAFGQARLLDLKGRGIRSIEWINNTYVIVGGPHGEAKKSKIERPFALFTWSGRDSDNKPDRIKNVTMPKKFSPEGVFALPGSSMMMLLSDDGDLNDCKEVDKAQKTFRALTLPAPK